MHVKLCNRLSVEQAHLESEPGLDRGKWCLRQTAQSDVTLCALMWQRQVSCGFCSILWEECGMLRPLWGYTPAAAMDQLGPMPALMLAQAALTREGG